MAKRSTSWSAGHISHARNQYSIDLPRDISPASALRISSANCHPAERDFADRVVHTSASLKSWCNELLGWQWHGIRAPSQPSNLSSLVNDHIAARQGEDASIHVNQATAWGSLPVEIISVYKERLQRIDEELQDLDIEELKHHVLLMHLRQQSSEPAQGPEDGPMLQGYHHLDTVTALISTTVLQSLPHYSRLNSLLTTWSARIAICELIPLFFNELQIAQTAVSKAWQRLELLHTELNRDFHAQLPLMHSEALRTEYESLKNDVSFKVSRLGRRVDKMLDRLEGSPDSLPDVWLDTVDTLEASYSSWIVEANSKILELNLGGDQSSDTAVSTDQNQNAQQRTQEVQSLPSVEVEDVARHKTIGPDLNLEMPSDKPRAKAASPVSEKFNKEPVHSLQPSDRVGPLRSETPSTPPKDTWNIVSNMAALVTNSSTVISDRETPLISTTKRQHRRTEYGELNTTPIDHFQTAQDAFQRHDDTASAELTNTSEPPHESAISNDDPPGKLLAPIISADGLEPTTRELFSNSSDLTEAPTVETATSQDAQINTTTTVDVPSMVTAQRLLGYKNEVDSYLDTPNGGFFRQIPSIKLPDFSVPSTAAHSRHASQTSRYTSHSRNSSNDLSRRHSEQSLLQASRLSPVSDYSIDPAAVDPVIRSASITSMAYVPMSKIRRVSIFRSMSDPAVLQSVDDTSLDALDLSSPGPIIQAERDVEERPPFRHASPPVYESENGFVETANSHEVSRAPDSPLLTSTEVVPQRDEESDGGSDGEEERSPSPNGRAWRGSLGKLDLDAPRDEVSPEYRQGTGSSSSSSLPTPVADEFSFLQTRGNLHIDRPPSPAVSEFSEAGDRLDREIDKLITSLPTRIRFKRRAHNNPIVPARTPPRVIKGQPSSSVEGDPSLDNDSLSELTLAPAPRGSRPKRGSSDIKVYFLTPPGKSKPIKLYVRLVGENGERVMVRVGGGWADLGEYLREYAAHHGHVVTPEKTALLPGSLHNRKNRVVSAPGQAQRPKTPTSSRPGATNGRRTVTFSQPDVPEVPKLPRPSSRMSNVGSGPTSKVSQSHLVSEANPETPPRNQDRPETPSLLGKRSELTPEKQAWLDDMVQRAKQWKREKDRGKSLEGFEDMGKVGSTRRIARISDIGVTPSDDRE